MALHVKSNKLKIEKKIDANQFKGKVIQTLS